MEHLVAVRTMDDLGRVVIPKSVRDLLGLEAHARVAISWDPEARVVFLRPFEPGCARCGRTDAGPLVDVARGVQVCRPCLVQCLEGGGAP